MDRKQYAESLAAFQRAVKLDPTQPDAHFRLGRLHQTMGDLPAAQQEYAKFRALHNKADENLVKMLADAPPALHP
jgi:tetratricopeptide (TPR) repeat protein